MAEKPLKLIKFPVSATCTLVLIKKLVLFAAPKLCCGNVVLCNSLAGVDLECKKEGFEYVVKARVACLLGLAAGLGACPSRKISDLLRLFLV